MRLPFIALLFATIAAGLPIAPPAIAAPESTAPAETAIAGRFTVTVEGKGPDVILIPGLASARSVWTPTIAVLKQHYRVHAIQVMGFAGTPAGANATGDVAAPLAEAVAGYIAANRMRAPAIIGHSLGGETALMLAARHPADVGRVLVVDALPFYSLLFSPAATVDAVKPQAAAFRDRMLAMTPAERAAGQPATIAALVKTEGQRAPIIESGLKSDPAVVARAVYELMTTDLRPELGRITAPVTVLYAYDPVYGVPPASIEATFAAAYAGTPKLTLSRIDASFHFIMLDQPAAFASAVADFLDQ